MLRYTVQRLLVGIFTTLVIVTIAFVALRVTPGDPAALLLGDYATPEAVEALRNTMGLNEPIGVQYAHFLSDLLRGEVGTSPITRQPVTDDLVALFPYTVQLTLASGLIALVIGIPLGTLAALKRGTLVDSAARINSLVWYAMPDFWLGLMLLMLFAAKLGWFPLSGGGDGTTGDTIRHLALPAATLGLGQAAILARMYRSAMLENLGADYVRTAYAKGANKLRVLLRHVYRNSLGSIVNIALINTIVLLSGSIVIETVFSRPGVGRLLVGAIKEKDYATVQGCLLLFAVCVVVLSLLADLLSAALDPRVRLGARG